MLACESDHIHQYLEDASLWNISLLQVKEIEFSDFGRIYPPRGIYVAESEPHIGEGVLTG